MRRLRTMTTRRIYAIVAVVALVGVSAGIAQGAFSGSDPKPPPKALDQAVLDALKAPTLPGVTARIHFENNLLPAGSLPEGQASPLAAGANGRLWVRSDDRFRLELQSEAGDAQIVSDGQNVTVYDASQNTVYKGRLPEEKRRRHQRAHPEPTLQRVQKGLARLAKYWNVSGAQPSSTAGQPTYTVRLSPKDDGGLLGAGELAWDAARGAPLRAAVYAEDRAQPVLELKATDISYDAVPLSDVAVAPPADAKVVDVDPRDEHGRHRNVKGVDAVQKQLDFKLTAPDQLAGLPRQEVRLVETDKKAGAASVYGKGFGAILVLQHKAGDEPKPARKHDGERDLRLPEVNIDGATGKELATALGTVVTFERNGIAYTVVGSVTPAAAEQAARGLR